MQTIKLLSDITPIAITQANFPSLQHAWVSSGVTGNVIADQIGDCDITCTGGITVADNTFAFASVDRSIAGTLFVPGQRDILAILCGSPAIGSVRVSLGDETGANGPALVMGGGAGARFPLLDNDQEIAFGASGITIAEGAWAFSYDNSAPAASCSNRHMIEDSTITSETGSDSTPTFGTAVDIPAMQQTIAENSGGLSPWGGWFIWAFPSGELPSASSIKSAAAWMAKNPGQPYPGMLGK